MTTFPDKIKRIMPYYKIICNIMDPVQQSECKSHFIAMVSYLCKQISHV